EQLDTATTELRELARGIHPAVLSDRGLGPALEALASRAALPVELGERPEGRLPAAIEAAAYFVVAEALTNAGRYARASRATASMSCARCAPTGPTWPSSTSRCPPTTATRGCGPPTPSAPSCPRWACSCSPSTSRCPTRASCSPAAPRGSAICSRTAWPTST